MQQLNPDTVLQLAPSLTVQLGAQKVIHVGGQQVSAPSNILSILDAFSQPVQYSVAVKNLSARASGAQAWIELVSNIRALHQMGVLVDESGVPPAPMIGWSAPQVHITMLNDRTRTDAFLAAIAAVVKEGDVVVDIGTGTGILALAAAKAGARHVYAIEANEIGQAAKDLFAANGFSDRITLVPGWSPRVELPEKANVLVAEIIGNDPLEEGVMETFSDARKRLLTPEARVIPSRVQVFGVPFEVEEKLYARFAFTPDATTAWREWYGFDFTPVLDATVNKLMVLRMVPHEIRDYPQLSDPILLADLDLSGTSDPRVSEAVDFTISRDGTMSGFLLYFVLDVAPGIELSTAPKSAGEKCSWAVKTWLWGAPRRVGKGQTFTVKYTYRVEASETRIEVLPV